MAAAPGPGTRWDGTVQSPRIRSDQIVVENLIIALAVDGEKLEVSRARARAAAHPDRGHRRLGMGRLGPRPR